jgi:hypothetical protein
LFLSTIKSKGNYYIYLYSYAVRQDRFRTAKTVYRFGRKEMAIKKMHHWRNNFEEFPEDLLALGCNINDLEDWIRTLETGITKTGKQFKVIV